MSLCPSLETQMIHLQCLQTDIGIDVSIFRLYLKVTTFIIQDVNVFSFHFYTPSKGFSRCIIIDIKELPLNPSRFFDIYISKIVESFSLIMP